MSRKAWVAILILMLILGGIGGVLFNRFVVPYLARMPGLSWMEKLESSNPVVINRFEEVQFNEGANFVDLARQGSSYTVSIYSQRQGNTKFLNNGIISSSDGMIITSRLHLGEAGTFLVVLNDGTTYPAVVRGLDPRSELAVLTIQAQNLPFAQFADAGNLQASQRLIFLGRSNNSFNRDFAQGQVSRVIANGQSLDRVFSSEALENTVAANVQINSDFIGGPILNLDGRVVGMTSSNLGIIIGEDLQTGVGSFLQSGKIQRPAFGIKYLNLSDELAKLKGLNDGGSMVVSVDPGSPAQKAGVQANDLIVSADGQDLSSNNFEKIINQHGFTGIPLEIIRNNNKINLQVILEPK
jgi:serine protease Do